MLAGIVAARNVPETGTRMSQFRTGQQDIVSGSRDSTVQVWIAQTGKHLTTYNGHAAEVLSAAWSPDDNRIVSAGVDTTAQIWDPQTGKPLIRYTGHSDPLNCHKLVT